eukprot:TRINITY_DN32997_c0_g1_i1.p1 TRINITY_DN32997_c0_g1~~TRINITY_DN32997_c0_g1_i1.p1  ORF type:complete len:222 (+),score=49.80 TRINITY_DN32997_c0_g1_i1:116-781(+)
MTAHTWWSTLGLKSRLFLCAAAVEPLPPPLGMRVLFSGEELSDQHTLAAAGVCDDACLEILLRDPAPARIPEPLLCEATDQAIEEGDCAGLEREISKGLDVDMRDSSAHFQPMLHKAVHSGSLEAVALLLRAGADVALPFSRESGTTALHMAAMGKNNECSADHCRIAVLLMLCGLSPITPANNGKTALDLATAQQERGHRGYDLMLRVLNTSIVKHDDTS